MNITVIGCGETGSTISALLLSNHKEITLNILDPNEDTSGRILDFEHAATCNGSKILWNDFESASNADFLFFTAGVRGKKGEDRAEKAKENKKLIAEIFDDLKPKRNALIITISNPTESMSYWISEHLSGRNPVVSTSTSLDTFRLQLIIAKHLKTSIQNVNTMVIGEHGDNMTPLWSQTTISGNLISEFVSEDELGNLTSELKNSATEIRKTEVATKYGVAQCAVTILSHYISPNKIKLPLSFPSAKIDQIDSDNIFVSWPCRIGNSSISAVQDVKMNDREKEQLQEAIEVINQTTNN